MKLWDKFDQDVLPPFLSYEWPIVSECFEYLSVWVFECAYLGLTKSQLNSVQQEESSLRLDNFNYHNSRRTITGIYLRATAMAIKYA